MRTDEKKSPDGKFVATVFYCSGGGAAGYTYNNINLRRYGEKIDQRDFLLGTHLWGTYSDMKIEWANSTELRVFFKMRKLREDTEKNGQRIEKRYEVNVKYFEIP